MEFVEIFYVKGNSVVEKSIYLINLIDWILLYFFELKNGDVIEIEIIDYFKLELGKI